MRRIALIFAALILAVLPGFGSAQGDGGSQTQCELEFSTCTQTARADYQFCLNASENNCQERLDTALQSCNARQNSCQNSTQGIQFSD